MYQTKYQEFNLESRIINLSGMTDRFRRWVVPAVLLLADYGAVMFAVWTTYILQLYMLPELLPVTQRLFSYAYIIIPLVVIFFMSFDNMYIRRMPVWQQIEKFFKITLYSCFFILTVLYFLEPTKHIPRTFTLIISIFIFLYILLGRYFTKRILTAANLWQIPIVLIGAGKTAEILLTSFEQDSGISYKVVGLVEDNTEKISGVFREIPIIGSFAKVEDVIRRTGIKNVLLAAPGLSRENLVEMVYC